MGCINRLPPEGHFKANLHLGGRAETTVLSNVEKKICKSLEGILKNEKLFFVGIDLIDETLTEINVTSPTCVKEIDQVVELDIPGKLIESLLKKLPQH